LSEDRLLNREETVRMWAVFVGIGIFNVVATLTGLDFWTAWFIMVGVLIGSIPYIPERERQEEPRQTTKRSGDSG
jgi:hypothetical protein